MPPPATAAPCAVAQRLAGSSDACRAAGKKGKKKGSPDKGSPGDKAPQCSEEIKRLQAELSLVQAALAAQHAAAHAREEELAAVRLQHAQDAAAAADVQASQRHEAEQLRAAARGLEDQLGAARQEAAALQRALQAELDSAAEAGAADAGGAGQPSSELQRALSHHRRQEERLAAQAQEMEGLRARLRRAEDSLAASVSTAAALQVRVASRSELRFVRGAPWLVHVGRERLTGPAPAAAQPGGTLAAVGRRLVLEGPSSGDAGDQPGQLQLHSLDLGSGAWAATPASGPAVEGRAVCSVGGKLLGVGSSCGGELLAGAAFAQFMAPDLQQWLPAPPPAGPPGAQPPPRRDAALAFCPRAGAAFLFGGTGEKGTTLGDLWHFDLARSTWSRLDTAASGRAAAQEPGCTHTAPPPCSGAALAVSPDGGRLWLMGGRLEGGRCSRALHW